MLTTNFQVLFLIQCHTVDGSVYNSVVLRHSCNTLSILPPSVRQFCFILSNQSTGPLQSAPSVRPVKVLILLQILSGPKCCRNLTVIDQGSHGFGFVWIFFNFPEKSGFVWICLDFVMIEIFQSGFVWIFQTYPTPNFFSCIFRIFLSSILSILL